MKTIFSLSLAILFLFSCDKNDDVQQALEFDIDCTNLELALLDKNSEQINLEINKLTQDLTPTSTPSDDIGHAENLDKLIERINFNCENIEATKICYACIETLPAQSEIRIKFESLGSIIERIIDISTPDDGILESISVHE